MSALPPDDMRSLRQSAFAARHPIDSLIARWETIAGEVGELASLAGLHQAAAPQQPGTFLVALEQASESKRELAWQAIEDIEALMQSGLAALEVLKDRGLDAQIPAMALWRELDAAQRSVTAMLETD